MPEEEQDRGFAPLWTGLHRTRGQARPARRRPGPLRAKGSQGAEKRPRLFLSRSQVTGGRSQVTRAVSRRGERRGWSEKYFTEA